MWFSSNRPDRPRRRPSHGTVIAYVALLVAVAGIPVTAVAAGLVHTRDIANQAVTTPKLARHAVGPFRIMNGAVINRTIRNDSVGPAKIRDGAVTRPKIRDHAITGDKVANNTLTGRNIDESTLRVARLPVHINGPFDFPVSEYPTIDTYPLSRDSYVQPADTVDLVFGELTIRYSSGCTLVNDNYRQVAVDVRGPGHTLIVGDWFDNHITGNDATTRTFVSTPISSPHHATTWHVTVTLTSECGPNSTERPQVTLHLDVLRLP